MDPEATTNRGLFERTQMHWNSNQWPGWSTLRDCLREDGLCNLRLKQKAMDWCYCCQRWSAWTLLFTPNDNNQQNHDGQKHAALVSTMDCVQSCKDEDNESDLYFRRRGIESQKSKMTEISANLKWSPKKFDHRSKCICPNLVKCF